MIQKWATLYPYRGVVITWRRYTARFGSVYSAEWEWQGARFATLHYPTIMQALDSAVAMIDKQLANRPTQAPF